VSIEGQTKETFGVHSSGLAKLERIVSPGRGDLRKRVSDPRGLVPFAPEGNGSQIRGIGLHQQALAWHESHQIVVAPLVECHDPAERDVPSRLDGRLRQCVRTCITVHDTEDAGGSSFADDRARVVFSVSGVDDHRFTRLPGERDLSRERGALGFARRIVVVIVESTFSNRHGSGQQLAQPRHVARRVKRGRVVGMDSGGGKDEAGIVGRNLGGYDRRRERLTDANDRPRARIAGARDYRAAVAGEGRVREVGVAVDEDGRTLVLRGHLRSIQRSTGAAT